MFESSIRELNSEVQHTLERRGEETGVGNGVIGVWVPPPLWTDQEEGFLESGYDTVIFALWSVWKGRHELFCLCLPTQTCGPHHQFCISLPPLLPGSNVCWSESLSGYPMFELIICTPWVRSGPLCEQTWARAQPGPTRAKPSLNPH